MGIFRGITNVHGDIENLGCVYKQYAYTLASNIHTHARSLSRKYVFISYTDRLNGECKESKTTTKNCYLLVVCKQKFRYEKKNALDFRSKQRLLSVNVLFICS